MDTEVALLAGDPAFESLDVIEMRFRFDQSFEAPTLDKRVRTPAIAFDRHWNLRTQTKARFESRPEPIEERQVRFVTHRIALGMEGHAEL